MSKGLIAVTGKDPVLELGRWILMVILPLLLVLFAIQKVYLGLALLIGSAALVLVFQNYRTGLWFLIIGLPLFQSFAVNEGKISSIGVNLQYLLIPTVFLSWIFIRIYSKTLHALRWPLSIPIFSFLFLIGISLLNQSGQVSGGYVKNGFFQMLALFNYIILFYMIVNEGFDYDFLKKIFWWMTVVSLLAAVIGILQFFIVQPNDQAGYRVASTFSSAFRKHTKNNPNAFGTYLALMLVVHHYLWTDSTRKNRKVLVFSGAVVFVSLLLTFSRSSLLSVFFAFFLYTVFKKKKAVFYLIPAFSLGIALLYWMPAFHRRFESVLTVLSDPSLIRTFVHINPRALDWAYVGYFGMEGYNSDIVSAAFRIWAWIDGMKLFAAHPAFGVGYHLNSVYSFWPTAENLYIDILAMLGTAGFIVFVWIQARFIRDGFQMTRQSDRSNFGFWWLMTLAVLFFVSLTGSILFNGKLLGFFWILGGLFYCEFEKEKNSIHQP